jgi:hypothetical protein
LVSSWSLGLYCQLVLEGGPETYAGKLIKSAESEFRT